MALSLEQRLTRLGVRLEELRYWRAREGMAIGAWTLDGRPIGVGDGWPSRNGVHKFAATAEAPAHWPLEETVLGLDLGGEGLVTLSYPNRQKVSFGLDPYHREFPLRHRQIAIAAECTARDPFGVPVRAPRLNRAVLQWIDGPVDRLHLLFRQIAETCAVLGGHAVVPHLLDAAEGAQHALDWPSESVAYVARMAPSPQQQSIWELPAYPASAPPLSDAQRQTVSDTYDGLLARLDELRQRFPQEGELLLTGHAHIDLSWLWPYNETRRKLRRTFHSALALMEESAEFRFNQSTAHYYAQLGEDDPALLAAIKRRVASGQWETIGGMWVEPDTNMPTGESLARQLLYGQRFFEKEFGARHSVCWLPDCFGFSGALPQLLVQAGIRSFFTIKVNWSETNRIPADLFWWEGLDGSRVLAHTFDNPMAGYNGFVQADCLVPTWRNFRGKVHHDSSLLAVGYGDGGGGVTAEMIAREVQLRHFPAIPRARWGNVSDYFARAHARARDLDLPVWSGEIYLELHRATLTTQSGIKRRHRQAERALITAETVASMAHLMGAPAPRSLEPDWRVVLKNEFHDILPGSSVAEVYADAASELDGVIANGRAAQAEALAAIAARMPRGSGAGYLVVNPTAELRRPAFLRRDGMPYAAWTPSLPPLSATVLDEASLTEAGPLAASPRHLENTMLRADVAEDGTIASLVLKQPDGREALAGPGNQLWVYPVDKPRSWDAWDVEADYAARGELIDAVESIALVESSRHRAKIRVARRWRHSRIVQTYVLWSNSLRLDIETEIDWHDRRCFLRALTPVAVRAARATFECANGVVTRPTHENTSWDQAMFEAAAHRFIDLSEPGFGVALLNDAKYGHSVRSNVLGISLLRAPIYPDPLADEGEQRFTYALMPHAGAWHEAGVRQEADDLNQPLSVLPVEGLAAGSAEPLGFVHGAALSALKPAEDGRGLILRLYEPAGGRGAVAFTPPQGWRADPVTILEDPDPRGTRDTILPFEVRSWRLSG